MEKKINADTIDEMKRNYYSKSEKIFNITWDLTEDQDDLSNYEDIIDDTIVKNLYKDFSELNIKDTSNKEDNSSSDTVIHNIKQEDQDNPDPAVPCPPILGGLVYTSNCPSGMVRSTLLGLTNKTKPIPTSTVSTISLSSTTRQEGYSSNVIHEHDCSCPYRFVRKSNKKKL